MYKRWVNPQVNAREGEVKKVLVVMLVGGLLSLSATAFAQTASPVSDLERTVAYVQPSVVYLDITWKAWVFDTYRDNDSYLNDGQPFVLYSSCTGFFVDDTGTIATAGHCIDPTLAVVLDHKMPVKPHMAVNLKDAVNQVKGEAGRRDEKYQQLAEAEKNKSKVLEAKFQELFKKAKEEPLEKPLKDIDLD